MCDDDVIDKNVNNNNNESVTESDVNNVITDSGFITVGCKRPSSSNSRDPRKCPRQDPNNSVEDIALKNRFTGLPVENIEIDEDTISKVGKSTKPPPIHLSNVTNYEALISTLRNISTDEFLCKGGLDKVVIYPNTPSQYRLFVKYLRGRNASFHTYQLPEDKLHRVVLKGLHHTTSPDAITNELLRLGFKVKSVVNVISRFKIPLPMFYVDLEKSDNTDEIYHLTHLLQSIVNVEELRRNRHTVQCTRCQAFNHSKTYCNRPPRCVRCAGNHFTTDCKKEKNTPATCALCNGQHTANYRGCSVYQDLQQKRKHPLNTPTPQTKQQNSTLKYDTPALTADHFPELRRHQSNNDTTSHPSNTRYYSPPQHHPAEPSHQNNTFRQASYSSAVTGEHHPVTDINKITHMMSNFISDIKSLIMPLMSLLTQLTHAVLNKNAP